MATPSRGASDAPLESRFVLEGRIGRGAFGEVFRATDRETGQAVAVKRLLSGAEDPEATRRFELESRLLARVEHPNVVRYVAHGLDQGQRWLALEWLDG